MAKIERKLKTQQRYADIARGRISGFSCGHVYGLSLADGERGVAFTVPGVATGAKYDFHVAMTVEEWDKLKKTLDGMLERSSRDKENYEAGRPHEDEPAEDDD